MLGNLTLTVLKVINLKLAPNSSNTDAFELQPT